MKMKKLLFLAVMMVFFASCEKDPDLNKLDSSFTVYTNYDDEAAFENYDTFYLPDSILLGGQGMRTSYWKDENAQKLIQTVANELTDRGYTRIDEREKASLGVQLSYAEQTTQITGWVNGMYDGWYGGWWDLGFWGPYWGGWYYPYPVSYSYDTGTLIMELVDLTARPSSDDSKVDLPVIWQAYTTGLLSGSSHINMSLAQESVNQAFEQSPYINR